MLQQLEITQQHIALLVFLAALVILLLLVLRLRKKKTAVGKPEVERQAEQISYFDKIRHGLSKTRQSFLISTSQLFGGRKIDNALLEELEESLILADLGPRASESITEAVRS